LGSWPGHVAIKCRQIDLRRRRYLRLRRKRQGRQQTADSFGPIAQRVFLEFDLLGGMGLGPPLAGGDQRALIIIS
jgi:hypothetical protein